jgi:hypothetical protein
MDAADNLLVLVPPGVGKTHILVAMAMQAIHDRIPVYFTIIQDLVADLRKAWDENRFAARLATYLRPRLLCIDEVGRHRNCVGRKRGGNVGLAIQRNHIQGQLPDKGHPLVAVIFAFCRPLLGPGHD